MLAYRRLERVANSGLGNPREVASRGLNAINAISEFDLPNMPLQPRSRTDDDTDDIMVHMINAIVGTNDSVNSFRFMFQFQSDDVSDTDNDDNASSVASISTTATDGSISALRQFTSSRDSSRRGSHFRSGQR